MQTQISQHHNRHTLPWHKHIKVDVYWARIAVERKQTIQRSCSIRGATTTRLPLMADLIKKIYLDII